MTLKCYGSSSIGNCYSLHSNSEVLIIEAGIKPEKVLREGNINVMDIAGVLISHSHKDHSKYVDKWRAMGVEVLYQSNEKQANFGGFNVQLFDLEHDVPCVGFLISHTEMGRLIFLTDTASCLYRFKNIDHWLVECNHDDETMTERLQDKELNPFVAKRVGRSHMSLDQVVDLLRENKVGRTAKVVLLHLSKSNSNTNLILKTISNQFTSDVYIAESNLNLKLWQH